MQNDRWEKCKMKRELTHYVFQVKGIILSRAITNNLGKLSFTQTKLSWWNKSNQIYTNLFEKK
jgi:hypothetical protein